MSKASYNVTFVSTKQNLPPLNVELILKDETKCDQYFTSMVGRTRKVVLVEEYPEGILGVIRAGKEQYYEFFRKKDFYTGIIQFTIIGEAAI